MNKNISFERLLIFFWLFLNEHQNFAKAYCNFVSIIDILAYKKKYRKQELQHSMQSSINQMIRRTLANIEKLQISYQNIISYQN